MLEGVVRLKTGKRRRSQAWRAVFVCACLAMVLYTAFDLLDLDGSGLRRLLPGSAGVAAAVTERVFPHVYSTPEILGAFAQSPFRWSVSAVSQPSPCSRATTFTARQAHRSLAYASREVAATLPPPEDPA
jgi:hypothetical protein